MTSRLFYNSGPYGTCNKCGFSGNDWAFKYQGLCTKCYKKWKNQKAEELRKLKPINRNEEISKGVVITSNVKKRLTRDAQAEIPLSSRHIKADSWSIWGISIPIIYMIFLYFLKIHDLKYWVVGFITIPLLYAITDFIISKELDKRLPVVDERLKQLAQKRKQRIDEYKRFYQSSEWRLLRNQIIKEHGNVCRECGKKITDKNDLTIDHILPRSKFLHKALENSNLRVLCRSCNSKKGDFVDINNNIYQ